MTEPEKISLSALATIDRGISWSKSQEHSEPAATRVPVLRIGNVQERLTLEDLIYLSGVGLEQRNANGVGKDSIIMVGSNGNHERIGNCCFISQEMDFLFASFLIGVIPHTDLVDAGYLYYSLASPNVQAEITRSVSGSTGLANLSLEFLRNLKIRLPEKRVQRKIGEILSTVDRAIEQTEVLIAKYQRIKTGLMHDLLTRGIDEHGQLRDPATHAFKPSPLGMIPAEWKITTLSATLMSNPQNGIYKPASLIGRGTLLVGQTSITDFRSIDFSVARRAMLTSDEIRSYGLRNGDILISRVFATVDGVGQPTLVPELPEPAVFESNMMRLSVDSAVIAPALLFFWLRSAPIRNQIMASVNASNQASINQRKLNTLPVVIPSRDEQIRLLSVLVKFDELQKQEESNLRKQRRLKQGLVQDLLTGKVSVEPLLANESSA